MRTAGLLLALSALVATSVHAADPTVVEPVATMAPNATQSPVTEPVETKAPVDTKAPDATVLPTTTPPANETKAPEPTVPTTTAPPVDETKAPQPTVVTTTAPPVDETKPPCGNGRCVQPTPEPQPTKCTVHENKDRLGFDLASAKGKRDTCDAACEKTNGCLTWTWNDFQDGTCWLKSHGGKIVDKWGVSTTDCVLDRPSLVCNAFTDIDFVGMDIGSKPGKGFVDCCDICSEFSGCTAYAWTDFNGGTCWLKKSVGHVVAKVGVTSGSTVQLWGPVCPFEYDTDFVGNDIGNKPAADAGVCCSLCKGVKECRAYTWSNHNGGTCWMKSGKGKTVAASGVISAALV